MNKNIFPFTDNNKRYHTLDYFYKHKFASKVFKVSLNAGFTCPNIDGKCGTGGCIYCSNLGSGDFAGNVKDSLVTQFHEVKTILHKKWPQAVYIGYFQAHTNTYAPVSILKEKYEPILKIKGVVGLSIATRADSIDEACLTYLEELNQRTNLTIELGLQTIHEKTSTLINRCHSLECFTNMVKQLRNRNIAVVVHIMNGLPGETKEMMLETVRYLNTLDIQGIKIHMLHIVKNTKLALLYQEKKFPLLTKEEYVSIVCDQLELLRPEIVIHRITGDPKKEDLIAPTWLLKKFDVLNSIDKELVRRNTYQGFGLSYQPFLYKLFLENIKRNDLIFCQFNHKKEFLHLIRLLPSVIIFSKENIQKETTYEQLKQKLSFLYFENSRYFFIYPAYWLELLNQKGMIVLSSSEKILELPEGMEEIVCNQHYFYILKKN